MIMPARPNLLWKALMKSESNNIHLTSLWMETHYFLYTRKHRWSFKTKTTHDCLFKRKSRLELMNKDELAFLRTHHRSCISRAHLSEHERSWNAHPCPILNPMSEGGGSPQTVVYDTRVGFPFNAIFTDDLHVNALTCNTNDAIAFASIRSA